MTFIEKLKNLKLMTNSIIFIIMTILKRRESTQMSMNKNDYEHMLFYFAYKTFITTADEIIEEYGMSRQHHRFYFSSINYQALLLKNYC